MTSIQAVGSGTGRVILVIAAHADDMALFLGGTVAICNDAGWRVVRVTDDRWDSVGLSEADTIATNTRELRAAASILAVHWEEIEATLRRLPSFVAEQGLWYSHLDEVRIGPHELEVARHVLYR